MIKINKNGQGILEVMTAIYVFIVALVSIMNLVVFNIQTNALNTDILIASNLAREAVEVVRSIRDSNWERGYFFANDLKYTNKTIYFDENAKLDPHSTYILKNKYLEGSSSYGYEVTVIGTSWINCIDPLTTKGYKSPAGGSKMIREFCKLYLITDSNNNKQYDYNIYYLNSENEKEVTQFYRIIYINEICKLGDGSNGETILKDKDFDISANSNIKHCVQMGLDQIGMQVIARVAWRSSRGLKEIKIEEKLYNWQEDKTTGSNLDLPTP